MRTSGGRVCTKALYGGFVRKVCAEMFPHYCFFALPSSFSTSLSVFLPPSCSLTYLFPSFFFFVASFCSFLLSSSFLAFFPPFFLPPAVTLTAASRDHNLVKSIFDRWFVRGFVRGLYVACTSLVRGSQAQFPLSGRVRECVGGEILGPLFLLLFLLASFLPPFLCLPAN